MENTAKYAKYMLGKLEKLIYYGNLVTTWVFEWK